MNETTRTLKTVFLYGFEKSSWKSCEIITANLLNTYRQFLAEDQVLHYHYGTDMSEAEIYQIAKDIHEINPHQIVILDHRPHPQKLLKYLDHFYASSRVEMPELIVHVFGDFTLNARSWMESENFLKKYRVKFICASDRQKDLISKFMKHKNAGVYKFPFPVDSDEFYFSPDLRASARKELLLEDNEVLFLYTGRMSLQKKILELTFDFAQFLNMTNANAYLYFIGGYDDIANPFIGIRGETGEFCQRHIILLDKLDPEIRKRIRFIGNLAHKGLLKFYLAADYYISMSVHNDEDFGMSPAEALCTGLPAILTDWAGYASFNLEGRNNCKLIPVSLEGSDGVEYKTKWLLKELVLAVNSYEETRKDRPHLMKINHEAFSIKSNVKALKEILNIETGAFRGFSVLLEKLALAFEAKRISPFGVEKSTVSYSSLYKETYASYLQK